jgi:integrase/recombinase XerD
MTDLRCAVSDYLIVRRRLGFALKEAEQDLTRFVEFMDRAGTEHVTSELALSWAMSVPAHPNRWRRRLGVVRDFARYLGTIDPQTQIPSEDLLTASLPRVAPYIYSDAEIEALMRAASALTPRLRAATLETLIGLMAVIGLRAGEALGLDRAAVDLQNGLLHVRSGKWGRQREVPLHDTTARALRDYGQVRDQFLPQPATAAFFVSDRGSRMTANIFNRWFVKLIKQVGLEGAGQRGRPRPHDLRHAYAVHTLIDWYQADEDINAKLPLLSTILGHADPASTYWYLQASPELLALARDRLEREALS